MRRKISGHHGQNRTAEGRTPNRRRNVSVEGVWHLKGNHRGPPQPKREWVAVRCQLRAGRGSKVPADGGEEAVRCQLGEKRWHRVPSGWGGVVVGYQPIQLGGG